MLAAMLFLTLALDSVTSAGGPRWVKWFHFGAAGFFCALGLYGYPSGRAITVAMAAFVPVSLLRLPGHRKTLLAGYLFLFGVEAVVFAPQGAYIARNWDWFNGRTKVVVILNNTDFKADPAGMMLKQLDRNLRGPWDGRVNNTAQYSPAGEPQLDRITGILVLGGMVQTVFVGRLRRRPETLLWWLMMLAVGDRRSCRRSGRNGPGGWLRLLLTPGRGPRVKVVLERMTAGAAWIDRRLPAAALLVIVLATGYANVRHYVAWQRSPRTRQDRYIYITAREFPEWAAYISDRARYDRGSASLDHWRADHPIQSAAEPYGPDPTR
jgi:hypothetical protein